MVELKEQELVNKMCEITAENAIKHMKMSKLLYLTKQGRFYNNIANDYIEKMTSYSVYCKQEQQINWVKSIEQLVCMAGEVDDCFLLSELYTYENAAKLMEAISGGYSWEDIKKNIHEQEHFCSTISSLGQIMLYFSPYGVKFVEEVIGNEWIELLENLKFIYDEEKKKI